MGSPPSKGLCIASSLSLVLQVPSTLQSSRDPTRSLRRWAKGVMLETHLIHLKARCIKGSLAVW